MTHEARRRTTGPVFARGGSCRFKRSIVQVIGGALCVTRVLTARPVSGALELELELGASYQRIQSHVLWGFWDLVSKIRQL